MLMLTGIKNDINEKLVGEISKVSPVHFLEFNEYLESTSDDISMTPQIIIINLMDVGSHEEAIRLKVRNNYPDSILIAIHCYQRESMILRMLDNGYDAYFSVFDITMDLPVFLSNMEMKKLA